MSAIPRPFTILGGANGTTSSAVIADNSVVRGDGGARGIQDSGLTISDVLSNNVFLSGVDANTDVTIRGGLAGATITLGRAATGAITLTAQGTNQPITLTPSGTGQVVVPAGTAALPSLTFAGNTNIGLSNSSGDLVFSTSAAEAFRILITSGNLRISGTRLLKFGVTASASIGVSADTTAGNVVFSGTSTGIFTFDKAIRGNGGFQGSAGTAGLTQGSTACLGKSITVENGLITAFA